MRIRTHPGHRLCPAGKAAAASVITRRDFIKSTTLTTAAAISGVSFPPVTFADTPNPGRGRRLLTGWEHHLGALGGPWDVWRRDAGGSVVWRAVEMPHCFNARDAVDPDEPCYQGPGWYRTRLKVENPFPRGRTLLHFEGAGQKSRIFVDLDEVGEHTGGYDEFVVDITDAAARALKKTEAKGEVPVAVLCDNSRDLEMIPSSLSDFNRYGGLYRYVNLCYLPALSLERVRIESSVQADQSANIAVKARLFNPRALSEAVRVSVRVFDPDGALIHSSSRTAAPWKGEAKLAAFAVKAPQLWSPSRPALYRCEVTLGSSDGETSVAERFGLRSFEFVSHGPFKLNGERLLLRGTHRHEDHALLGAANARGADPAGDEADQADGREFHPPRSLSAVSHRPRVLRRARHPRLGRDSLVPRWARGRAISTAGLEHAAQHDRPTLQSPVGDHLGPGQRER